MHECKHGTNLTVLGFSQQTIQSEPVSKYRGGETSPVSLELFPELFGGGLGGLLLRCGGVSSFSQTYKATAAPIIPAARKA